MNWLFLLSIITAPISLLFALVFLAIYWQRPDIVATRCWGVSYLLLVVAMATVGVRIALPEVNPHIFSSLLAVSAGMSCFYLYCGVRCWRDLPPVSLTFHLCVASTISALGIVAWLWPAYEPVMLVASRLYIGLFAALSVYALLVGSKPRNVGHYMAAAFLTAHPLIQAVSIYIVFFLPSIPDGIAVASIEELSSSQLAAINFVGLPIGFTGIALFCLLGVLLELGSKLREESLRDWLTDTYNRRGFIDLAKRVFALSRRRGSDISVVLFDMDNFKQINDSHGHDAGDKVLQTVAGILRERLRDSDIVARWGGEEFIVLLCDADEKNALQIAEELRLHLERKPLQLGVKAVVDLSASFGVAQRGGTDDTIDAVITRADTALYKAKHAGKNRVVASTAVVA